MEEKIKSLYQEYLYKKLDLVFSVSEEEEQLSTNISKAKNNDTEKKNDFHLRYKIIEKGNKYNFVDSNGKLIGKVWFDDVELEGFKHGFAWVRKDNKYNYINAEGKLISDEWFHNAHDFCNGYAVVINFDIDSIPFNQYNYIDKEGKLVWSWCTYAYDFKDGLGHIEMDYESNFIKTDNSLISNVWLDRVEYKDNLILVDVNDKKSFIAKIKGKFFIGYKKDLYYKYDVFLLNDSFLKIDGKITPIDISLRNYSVKKHFFGYELFNDSIKINIKYEPIKLYGERYILCHNKEQVYLYDRFKNSYKLLGQASKITYDNNIIFDKEKDKVYFINENELLDITKYYKEKLEGKRFSIIKRIKIETYDSFSYTNSEEIDRVIKEDNDRKKKLVEEAKKEEEEKRNNEQLIQLQQMEEERKTQANFLINNIELSLKKLEDLLQNGEINLNEIKRIKTDKLFIKENDYYVFDPYVLEHLHFYELSEADFHNVKVEGIDFHKTNVEIGNLLNCYNRSIRNCNFEGISISPFTDFTGVDIRGCHFSRWSNYHTIDFLPNFSDAIYDETTTYNGVPISKILNVKKKVMM